MKLLRKIIILGFILSVLLFAAGSVYIKFYGKNLIENALTVSLKKRFEIGAIQYKFPLGFTADDISLEGLMKARRINAQFSFWSIFGKKRVEVVYATVEGPVIRIERKMAHAGPEGVSNQPSSTTLSSKSSKPGNTVNSKNSDFEIFINKLFIEDGEVQYYQESTENNFEFRFKDLQMNIEHLLFPIKPQRTSFNLVARVNQDVVPFGDGKIGGSGWVDAAGRDMEAQLVIKESDGHIGLKANVVSLNNDMSVSGEVKIGNVFPSQNESSKEKSASVNALILDSLSSMDFEIGAQFNFKTKMDDFRVSAISFEGNFSAKPLSPSQGSVNVGAAPVNIEPGNSVSVPDQNSSDSSQPR